MSGAATPTLGRHDETIRRFADEVGNVGDIAVAGNRTRWRSGGSLADGARVVRAPAGIVSYTPDEMTVCVRAGTAVADLHAELARSGQRTALPERGGTVGGAVAVGENALCTLGRGRLRTAVLQVRYVSAEGRIVTGGGPTVKNVTGFDIPRLMTGSLGTLGCLAEVILRTNPIPEVSQWYAATDADPFAVQDAVLRPGAILWDGTTTWVQLEGHAEVVAAEAPRLATVGGFSEVEAPPQLPACRWSLAPGDLRSIDVDATGAFVASVGLGTVWAERPQPERAVDPVAAQIMDRLKKNFDPTGRLNPGRRPGAPNAPSTAGTADVGGA